jgi:hypothetical protein
MAGEPWDQWSAVADEPLVLATIGQARETWLTAAQIAGRCGLPPGRVQSVLETTPADLIIAPGDGPDRPPRYSTRSHYRATRGFFGRYLDALMSS